MELLANTAKDFIQKGKEYFIVILKKGARYSVDKETDEKIQLEHTMYLQGLRQEGVLVINGPVVDDCSVKGISIYNLQNKEDVKQLVESDPAIVSQQLIYEMHPWFGFPGDSLP